MKDIRFGLCCIFRGAPIKFKTTTARILSALTKEQQLEKVSKICLHNVDSLLLSLEYVDCLSIGAFRILSPIFPRITHPDVGYTLKELPDGKTIRKRLAQVKSLKKEHDIRLSFHPDQFIVLSSPKPQVVRSARRELNYQAMVAKAVGADVINVHLGGAYGDKAAAMKRFAKVFRSLSKDVRQRLTLENDDRTYSIKDLYPLCMEEGIPLVYDVHHHRCLPDGLSIKEATKLSMDTWQQVGREPYFHISSPKNGWANEVDNRPHADFIEASDFPYEWLNLTATVDVEAKAKELAVVNLMNDLKALFAQ